MFQINRPSGGGEVNRGFTVCIEQGRGRGRSKGVGGAREGGTKLVTATNKNETDWQTKALRLKNQDQLKTTPSPQKQIHRSVGY